MARNQLERRPQEVIRRPDQGAQVDPQEREKYVAGFGVWPVYPLAIPVDRSSKSRPTERVTNSIPLRFVIVSQPVHVYFQGAIMAPQSSEENSSCFKKVYMCMLVANELRIC